MTRLQYLCDLLEAGDPLPAPSRQWLQTALRSIMEGESPTVALELPEPTRQSRDALIRTEAEALPGSRSSKARLLADQARRIHSGRKSAFPWLQRADRLHRLPETERQYHNILK